MRCSLAARRFCESSARLCESRLHPRPTLAAPRRQISSSIEEKVIIETDKKYNHLKDDKMPWLKGPVPPMFWSNLENQRRYKDWLGSQLGYTKPEDWYRITSEDFVKNHGSGLLGSQYRQSPYAFLKAMFPEFVFLPWLFEVCPRGYFLKSENRRKYVDWLLKQANVKSTNELTLRHFEKFSGRSLLNSYGGSPQLLINSLNDDLNDDDSDKNVTVGSSEKRAKTPQRYWSSMENRKAFMDEVGVKIGASQSDISPWFKLKNTEFKKLGGSRMLNIYNGSIYKILKSVYPHSTWLPWQFKNLPRTSIKDPEVLKVAVDYLEKHFDIRQIEDWNRVSTTQLKDVGLDYLILQNGGLAEVLKQCRP